MQWLKRSYCMSDRSTKHSRSTGLAILPPENPVAHKVNSAGFRLLPPASNSENKESEGEIISPSTFIPPDIATVCSMTDEEKRALVVLALDKGDEDALSILRPLGTVVRNSIEVVNAYRPIILALKQHFCRRGGSAPRSKTWAQVCEEYLGISIRRIQQLLAEGKPQPGPAPTLRRARRTAAPVNSLPAPQTVTSADLPKPGEWTTLVSNFHAVFGAQMTAACAGLDIRTFESVLTNFLNSIAGTYGGKAVGYAYQVRVSKCIESNKVTNEGRR
jgi:hypothetical protein